MTNSEFEKLLELTIKNFGEDYIDYPEDLNKPFDFSEEFEKKMDKLIKRQKKPYYVLTSTVGRRVACIAASLVIVTGTAMSVKAIKNKIVDFSAEPGSSGMDNIIIDRDKEDYYPEIIEQEYTIDVPEGFEIDEERSDYLPDDISIFYTDGDKYIWFEQTVIDNLYMIIDNEESKVERRTDKSGVTYTIYFREDDNKYIVLWEDYDYLFKIATDYNKKDIIDLCRLTKKK